VSTQYPQVTIPDTEVRTLASSYVDQEYNIFVALPPGYADSDETYPTLYTTDGDMIFGAIAQIARTLGLGKERPQLIIVGIGYPVHWTDTQPYRVRDYVPAGWLDDPHAGEAKNFVQFVRKELIPWVESEYRVDPEDRCYVGDSLGGLLGLYILLSQPDTFSRYLIGSPWMLQDDPQAFSYERDYAAHHSDLPARVFMAAGSLEPGSLVPNVRKMAIALHCRGYDSLQLTMRIFEDQTHTSVIPYFLTGLAEVYK
jgi:predicted alpha/beta superfamily hydrolase